MSDQRETNFVPIEVLIKASISASFEGSTGMEMSEMIWRASVRARLKAEMMTTGWMLRSRWGRACARISPADKRKVIEHKMCVGIRGEFEGGRKKNKKIK